MSTRPGRRLASPTTRSTKLSDAAVVQPAGAMGSLRFFCFGEWPQSASHEPRAGCKSTKPMGGLAFRGASERACTPEPSFLNHPPNIRKAVVLMTNRNNVIGLGPD